MSPEYSFSICHKHNSSPLAANTAFISFPKELHGIPSQGDVTAANKFDILILIFFFVIFGKPISELRNDSNFGQPVGRRKQNELFLRGSPNRESDVVADICRNIKLFLHRLGP